MGEFMRRFMLAAIAAVSLVAPAPAQVLPSADIDALLAALPGVVATYETKSDIGGVIALDGLKIAMKNPDGTPDEANKVVVRRAEATGLDADAILAVFDGARYGTEPDQTFRSLFSQLDLRDVSVVAGGKTVATIASWSAASLEMKQFWFKPAADMRSQFGSDVEMAAKVLGNVLDSTRAGLSSISGLHLEIDTAAMAAAMAPGTPMPPSQGIEVYDYAEITVDGFDRGRWGRMTWKGLSSRSPMPPLGEMSVSVAEGHWDGADVSKLLPWLMRAEWPPAEREGLVSFGATCATSYVMSIPGVGTLDFPETCSEAIDFVWLIPVQVRIDMTGTFTPAPPGEFIAPPHVARHFKGPLDAGLTIEARYDPDAGTAALTHYGFRLGGFGSVDFSATGGGLALAGLGLLPQTYADMLTLNAAAVELVDEGGVTRILEMAADTANAESGGAGQVTAAALRLQAKAGLDMAAGMLGNSPEAAALIQPVKAFIDAGGTLTLRLAPPSPLRGADFEALAGKPPAEMLQILGVEASHAAP